MGRKNRASAGSNFMQWASWTIITLCLVFCFYIGIPLMLIKLHRDKANMLSNAKRTAVVGWIFFGFGCFYLIAGLTGNLVIDDGSSIVFGLIVMVTLFCGGGYAIVRYAKKYKKLGLLFERYLPVASRSPNGSLDDIAGALGEAYEKTEENIQKLIDAGLFEHSYIDKMCRCLVSPVVSSTYQPQPGYSAAGRNGMHQQQSSAESTPAAGMITVKCNGCGGINTVLQGRVCECEYCGSAIKGE